MIRFVVIGVLARRGISLLRALACVATLLGAAPALAGDRALIEPIGYSADAQYFAFEEFGISDGAGFAYSNIYVVDVQNDAWVLGTPIRVLADKEDTTLAAIRQRSRALAAPQLADFGLDTPAELVAMSGDGALDGDSSSLHFGVPSFVAPGAVSGDYLLRLSSFDVASSLPCKEWFDSAPLGFALTLSDEQGDRVIHRDDTLPRSRACPMTYRLYGVALPFGATSIGAGVALVSVFPHGFEGPDRRFLAVPLDSN